jgi:hypothetical protein
MTAVTPFPPPPIQSFQAHARIIQIAAAEGTLYLLDSFGRVWRGERSYSKAGGMSWVLLQTPEQK